MFDMTMAGQLAENLLRAWALGDVRQLRLEVERSLSLSLENCEEGELERRTLLKAVAGRIQSSPNVLGIASGTPECGLYLRLLSHLATGCGNGAETVGVGRPRSARVQSSLAY